MLSAQAFFVNGEIDITLGPTDSVEVRENPVAPATVQVVLNGVPEDNFPTVSASAVTKLLITGGDDGNEVLSNVVDEVVSQAATLGRMMPSWNLVSLATSMRCFAASRVRQWCEADSASLKSIVSVALRVPLPLVRR